MMTMMTRWQLQQPPDWSTNTTINFVWYDSDGEGKGNGGAGVMGWPVGQATLTSGNWFVKKTFGMRQHNNQLHVIWQWWQRQRQWWYNWQKMTKPTWWWQWRQTTLMTTTTNKMTENNDGDDDEMTMTTTTWLIDKHNNQPCAIKKDTDNVDGTTVPNRGTVKRVFIHPAAGGDFTLGDKTTQTVPWPSPVRGGGGWNLIRYVKNIIEAGSWKLRRASSYRTTRLWWWDS